MSHGTASSWSCLGRLTIVLHLNTAATLKHSHTHPHWESLWQA